jgi:hypothetical protein
LAGRVVLTIVYLLVRRVLGLAVLLLRRDLAKDAGLLALRHENVVVLLRGHTGPPASDPQHRPRRRPPGGGESAVGYRRIHGELTKPGARIAPPACCAASSSTARRSRARGTCGPS